MNEKARLLDKRVIERNLNKGLVTQTEVDEYLSNLPDMESKSELLVLDTDDSDDNDKNEDNDAAQGFNFESNEKQGPKNVYDF
ncbi:MAG: hypothetical protein JXX29_08815 [Deltaproteobacteria bacterium]|nr:hypothetical protein [Deltaproteobacteria bacterium]MBN2671762.1 hypothetical protein [Deltaproteobacteria bacterium]